jgi:hypothetical protein
MFMVNIKKMIDMAAEKLQLTDIEWEVIGVISQGFPMSFT